MPVRFSDRARGVLVIGGLCLSVLVATAAVAKLALPGLLDGDRPDPDVARPVAGVHGPVLLPIIEVSPVQVTPPPARKKHADQKVGKAKARAKGKDKAKNKAKGKNKAGGKGGPGSAGQSSGGEKSGGSGSGSSGSGHGPGAGGSGKDRAKGKGS